MDQSWDETFQSHRSKLEHDLFKTKEPFKIKSLTYSFVTIQNLPNNDNGHVYF